MAGFSKEEIFCNFHELAAIYKNSKEVSSKFWMVVIHKIIPPNTVTGIFILIGQPANTIYS